MWTTGDSMGFDDTATWIDHRFESAWLSDVSRRSILGHADLHCWWMADALLPQVVKTAVFFENATNSMEMILAYFVIFCIILLYSYSGTTVKAVNFHVFWPWVFLPWRSSFEMASRDAGTLAQVGRWSGCTLGVLWLLENQLLVYIH